MEDFRESTFLNLYLQYSMEFNLFQRCSKILKIIVNLKSQQKIGKVETNLNSLIINKMQTALKYQYLDHKNDRPIRYVLSGSLKQKYNEIPKDLEQTLRSTQKCPYTSIRELIIAFKRNDFFTTELHPCDILKQKYDSNPKLYQTQRQLNQSLRQIQESRVRFEKLENCLEQYNTLYNGMRKDEYLERDPMQPNQTQYEYNYRVYKKKNELALEKQNKYFQYLTFSQEFERATILASASQSHRFKPKESFDRIDNFRLLSDKSSKIEKQLGRLQKNFIDSIFEWKEFVKHGKSNFSEADRNKNSADWNKLNGQIDGIFTQMSDFSAWLDRDRREMRTIYQNNKNVYKIFLPDYIKTKEAYEISSKNSFYYQTIREEKNRLEDHLRKNYGLIVPYVVSPQFTKAITPIQNPKNRQLKNLIEGQLTPFQDAILYINGEYQKLYKEVCDNRDGTGARRKIEQNIKKFNKYAEMPNQNNKFAYHLIESCQKLLRIAK